MKSLILVVLIIFAVIVLQGCGPKMVVVSSGEKIACSECSKVIRSDIQTKQVKEKEVSDYTVREIKEICPDCQKRIETRRQAEFERQRRAEARREQEEQKRAFVGKWVWRPGGMNSDVILLIRSDGTGMLADKSFKWFFSEGGFRARIRTTDSRDWTKKVDKVFTGQVVGNGQRLQLSDFGFGTFSPFEKGLQTIFDRLE